MELCGESGTDTGFVVARSFHDVMVMKRSEPRRQMWDGHCAAAAAAAGPFMDVSAAKPPPSQCDALRDFNCLDNRPII